MSRRLSVVVSDRDYAELERLASEHSATVSDLVRDALRIGVWYLKDVSANPDAKLLLQQGTAEPAVVKFFGAAVS